MIRILQLLLVAFSLFQNVNAYTYNYSGTFSNTLIGATGTVTWDLNILPNDSVYGVLDFDGLPGNTTLCLAGTFSTIKIADSINFSVTNTDSDVGCASVMGAIVFLKAKLFKECDSIAGDYFYQGQKVGFYQLQTSQTVSCFTTNVDKINSIGISLSIYPNPGIEKLFIEISSEINVNSLTILNILGEKIYSKTISQSATIDISTFKSGIYFIQVLNDSGIAMRRFVKEY